jgi:hypothetical protein
MQQSNKYQPYTRCGCKSCRLGQSGGWGPYILQASKRKVRHNTRASLNSIKSLSLQDALDVALDLDFGIVSAGYTD